MKTWAQDQVLWWIQQRNHNILRGNNLENFNKAYITGTAFLASDVEFYQTCGLPCGVGLALKSLADKVKESKFIPMDVTQTPANSVKGELLNQTAGRKRKVKMPSK